VLPAIDLYNQACFETDEIDDIWPDRMLSPKLQPSDLALPQVSPERALRVRHLTTEVAGVRSSNGLDSRTSIHRNS